MIRTSQTHPLEVATLEPGPGLGRIGLTFCPGKQQAAAFTGSWQRDLGLDLDAVRDWGAAVVVTLVEAHELEALQVTALGDEVRARHIEWRHLPIVDVSVPDAAFEEAWHVQGEGLRARLRSGFDVLVHCKGGLGRAGMIAARLLVELGHPPAEAVAAVRKVRPGAVETFAQVEHVYAQRPIRSRQPSTTPAAVRDRAIGALLGLAVGDALGTTLEFKARDSYPPLSDIVGGGPFRLEPGRWTAATAMALALADSLLAHPELDPHDLMTRFCDWRDSDAYSCTGTCFDVGMTVSGALNRFRRTGDPLAGSPDRMSAGNGALMRLSPVAIRHWRNSATLREVARLQTLTTHGAAEAVEASVAYAQLIARAIAGEPRDGVLAPQSTSGTATIARILAGSWRGKPRSAIRASGYVAHSLEAALWSIGRTATFADAVLTAANLGEDADTTAAITGQLAGALYGLSAIPSGWLDKLAWREKIERVAEELFTKTRNP